MRVLVTGGTGFIGRHLVWRLVNLGDEVTCLVRPGSERDPLAELGVDFIEGDVTAPESLTGGLAGFDAVYHLAGCISTLDPQRLRAVNAEGVRAVAAACAACPTPPTLLVTSSMAAAGPSRRRRPALESDVPRPVSAYGRSKLAGEQAARHFADRVPITIVRPPIVFGEHDRATLELFRIARRGWHLQPTLRRRRFSVIHAADLAQVMVRLVEAGERLPPPDRPGGPGQGIYYAAHADSPSFTDLGRRIGAAIGSRVRVVPLPSGVTWAAAVATEIVGRLGGPTLPLTIDKAREATAGSWVCSGRKAADGLGLRMRMSLDERLEQTAAWYQAQGWL